VTSPPSDFAFRPRLDVSLQRIGREREPVMIVDGVLENAAALVDYAAREVSFAPVFGPQGGYPGIRAPVPLDYVGALARTLSPTIERAFGLERVKLARAECSFSLVTLAPGQLAPLQRIPHADTADPLQFAILHYLCDERFGGTAFYRHRATGFETLSPNRIERYEAARQRELTEAMPAAGYIFGDTEHYEQTGAVAAAFDRLVVYRSRTLHSGLIAPDAPLSADPRRGRLTANIFVNYRAL
jgi:hypothetical protein